MYWLLILLCIVIAVSLYSFFIKKDYKINHSPKWTSNWLNDLRKNKVWWEPGNLSPTGHPWYPSGPQLLKPNQGWKIPSESFTLYTNN